MRKGLPSGTRRNVPRSVVKSEGCLDRVHRVDGQSKADRLVIPQRVVDGDFAGWLRDAISERGITTRVLEMRAGVDHTTISRLMRGANAPTLATAVALLRALAPTTLNDGPRHHRAGEPERAGGRH